ncbi:GlxA family transcriptional regulator [Pelomonas sp. KK5]|uniref:GlxA family transcriptional regulator n=1 Tax=Pelomonas sp. KK5 TaxID=1855730 RepID=UPI00097C77B0|nr:helix-turn-helix domain-containing protein [Pelomonas sp. KK5]
MKTRVAIVLTERVWAGGVFLAQELLLVAGTLQSRSTDVEASRLFDVVLVGDGPVRSLAGLVITPDVPLGRAARQRFDVVLVPVQFAPTLQASPEEARLAAWIAAQHGRGALVVSLHGAVLLARSGLLDGRQATGPIGDQALFAQAFPQVRYTPSRRIVVSGQIICAGGINPTVDVCAHLVERFAGRAASRRFLRHASTESLPSYEQLGVWSAQFKQHGDEAVLKAQQLVEAGLAQPTGLAALARAVHLSERTLSRRFAAAVGSTLRAYTAECRLEQARILLRDGSEPLMLIADECGYASVSALVRAFTARHGVSLLRYRGSRP